MILLYMVLSNSFLIGRRRTVNFRNLDPWRHNYGLYKRECGIYLHQGPVWQNDFFVFVIGDPQFALHARSIFNLRVWF